jgi:molybdate transport system ATP-binding protein
VLTDTEAGVFVPPEQRRIGLVFQDARLFPHLNVANNLRYGLRRATGHRIAFDEVVDLLNLVPLLGRRPHTLSGGEKQRVAIGRALLSQPLLLAMDEPLASLDAQHKAEILPYLARLKTSLALPILYVTHALDEVARLADTMVLIRAGQVLASGPIADMLARADLPLAAREDAASVLIAQVVAHDPTRQLSTVLAGGQHIQAPLIEAPVGQTVRLRIPARDVIVANETPRGISVHNILPGTVRNISIDTEHHAALVEIALDEATALLARITPDAVIRLGLQPGTPTLALIKSMAMDVLAANPG